MGLESMRGKAVVFTVACGNPKYAKQAMALAMSVRLHGSTAPLVLLSDCADAGVRQRFDAVVKPVPGIEPYLQKLVALQQTEAQRVLFLDSDSLAVRNVDELLNRLEGKSFAAMGDWITDGYYWGDTVANLKKLDVERIARMNGGLLYYERTDAGQSVVERSLEVSRDYDRLGLDRLAGKIHDEGCVSPAMSTTGLGELIPDTLGYSLTPWTCAEVHLDITRGECYAVNGYRGKATAVRPFVYHSAMSGWDLRYWREVGRLVRTVRRAEALQLRSGKPMPTSRKITRKVGEAVARAYRALFLRDF